MEWSHAASYFRWEVHTAWTAIKILKFINTGFRSTGVNFEISFGSGSWAVPTYSSCCGKKVPPPDAVARQNINLGCHVSKVYGQKAKGRREPKEVRVTENDSYPGDFPSAFGKWQRFAGHAPCHQIICSPPLHWSAAPFKGIASTIWEIRSAGEALGAVGGLALPLIDQMIDRRHDKRIYRLARFPSAWPTSCSFALIATFFLSI